MVNDVRLARAVTRAIERSVLTAVRLAEAAGISYDAVASWRAERRSPSPETVLKIADALEDHAKAITQAAETLRKAVGK